MQNKTPQSGTLLLLLARQADSLCATIQSWAIACRWGDLSQCHSVYDLFARLDDIDPQQPIIILGRPEMLSGLLLSAIQHKHPALRLIHWNSAIRTASETIAADQAVITVSNTDQLTSAINALESTFPCKPIQKTPLPEKTAEKRPFDPKDYRLSGEEINALLGDG